MKLWTKLEALVIIMITLSLFLGYFHVYCIFFIIFAMITNGYLFYALPFLELYQEYECPKEIPECTHKDRCLNKEGIKINWDSHKSLENWVQRFELECKLLYHIYNRWKSNINWNDWISSICWLDGWKLIYASFRRYLWKKDAVLFKSSCGRLYILGYHLNNLHQLTNFQLLPIRDYLSRKVLDGTCLSLRINAS